MLNDTIGFICVENRKRGRVGRGEGIKESSAIKGLYIAKYIRQHKIRTREVERTGEETREEEWR